MSLNFWPRVTVRHPTDLKGQIYIPSVNIILWFGCILMVLYFKTSENMTAAYGFSITVAMLMTTVLLSYFLIYIKKWNIILVIGILLLFGTIETSFFITNVAKIKQRWMFLFFEAFIFHNKIYIFIIFSCIFAIRIFNMKICSMFYNHVCMVLRT